MSMYLNASTLAGNTHMAALMDELDKVNADAEKLRDRRDSFAAIKETPTIGKFRAKT
jgi:hypothetical protein